MSESADFTVDEFLRIARKGFRAAVLHVVLDTMQFAQQVSTQIGDIDPDEAARRVETFFVNRIREWVE
jgi:hypothetical protein